MCFCSSPATDKGVNKNANNLITNKPILEIEKPIWGAESILLATLPIQEFTVLEKKKQALTFSVFFKLLKPKY